MEKILIYITSQKEDHISQATKPSRNALKHMDHW